jgi:hypothetical protein
VRLCNPCVPDPNTAPPSYSHRSSSHQGRHSRSASTTAVPQNTTGDYSSNTNAELAARRGNYQRRPREPSILGGPPSSYYLQSQNQSRGTSYNERGDRLLRPDDFQSRSRSSTVSHLYHPLRLSHILICPQVGSSRDQTMVNLSVQAYVVIEMCLERMC